MIQARKVNIVFIKGCWCRCKIGFQVVNKVVDDGNGDSDGVYEVIFKVQIKFISDGANVICCGQVDVMGTGAK